MLWLPFFLAILLLQTPHRTTATDADELLKFKATLGNNKTLSNWNPGSNPCASGHFKWVGVLCEDDTVFGLQLENISLTGRIDANMLSGIKGLRTISFKNNKLDGPMPEIAKLGALKSVYLSNNNFSGEIPDNAFEGMVMLKKVYLSRNQFTGRIPSSLVKLDMLIELGLDENRFVGEIPDNAFEGMVNLKKVYLSRNQFTGRIPSSLVKSDMLIELGLEENRFVGEIPDFPPRQWSRLNFSYNELEGRIPSSFKRMMNSSFVENKDLCGKPLDNSCKKKFRTPLLITIIVVSTSITLAIIGGVVIFINRRRGPSKSSEIQSTKPGTVTSNGGDASPENAANGRKAGKGVDLGSLVFVREDRERFELNDLLRSSAQVLGNGSLGSSYKAILLSGPLLVVKRVREMNGVDKQEFQEHMRKLGRLTHPNLVPLLAFHYRKDEMLLVSDYVAYGSLEQLLHSRDRRLLSWPIRLNIIKGVARGMAHLFNELPNQTLPHGHLKSSNVLLDQSLNPSLTDYSLGPVMNKDYATQHMVAHQAPECARSGGRATKKSDIWSFGILILEILTGRSPGNYRREPGNGSDLVNWVNSVVREEWTGEVFDKVMVDTKKGEGQMLELLQIGLGCCERDVDKRWGLKEAVAKIEELKERDVEEFSSLESELDAYSSREEFSFSMNR